jgi:hypothetical protein
VAVIGHRHLVFDAEADALPARLAGGLPLRHRQAITHIQTWLHGEHHAGLKRHVVLAETVGALLDDPVLLAGQQTQRKRTSDNRGSSQALPAIARSTHSRSSTQRQPVYRRIHPGARFHPTHSNSFPRHRSTSERFSNTAAGVWPQGFRRARPQAGPSHAYGTGSTDRIRSGWFWKSQSTSLSRPPDLPP